MADSSGGNRDTNLTIRVKDLGSKTFKEVASSVDKVANSLDSLVVDAERGEVKIGSLKDAITKLRDANKELVKQQAAVDFYEQLAAKLEIAKANATTARGAFEQLAATQQASSKVTKEQASQLASLETAATRAEAGVVKATTKLDAQKDKLAALGIETESLAAHQQQLAQTNAIIERSLTAVTSAYENYDANIARTIAAEQALAAAQKAQQDAARATVNRQDLAFQEQVTAGLHQQEAATLALADAEQRKAAADRASSVRADLGFQSQLEAAMERQAQLQKALAAGAAQSGFRQIGVDAVDAASKIDAYAAASGRATPASSRLAASLNAILNPAAELTKTLDGLESEIDRVAKVIGDGKGSVHSYAEEFVALDRVQRDTLKTAGNIDAYKNQAAAVKTAQAAFDSAKADVINYGNAIRTSAAPNDALVASLRQAEAALAAQEKGLTGEIVKLRELGAALTATGVDVGNLAKEETRLAAVANNTAAATAKLAAASSGKNGKLGTFLGLKPYELQNLSFQLNDVFTQIASGTSVTQTFAQQGGQIAQLFPKFFSSLIPLAPVILSVAGGLALVFAALQQIFDLKDSEREFAATLTLSADGATYQAKALAETAHELDVYGTSLKDARKEVETFLNKGLDPSRIQEFGVAAQDLADVTGIKVPEAADKLATAFTRGLDAIDKLDEEYHFLTASQRASIKLAFDEGRASDGRTEAWEAFRKKAGEAAAVSRDDLDVALRNLTETWDGFLHSVGNLLPIQAVAEVIGGLAQTIKDLTAAIPKAKAEADKAKGGPTPPPKAAPLNPFAGQVAGTAFGPLGQAAGMAIDLLRARGAAAAAEQKKQAAAISGAVSTANDTIAQTGDTAEKTNQRVLEGLRLQFVHTKELADAERIRLSGLKALREAEKGGATGSALTEATQIGEEFARQEIAKEKAQKAAAAGRKADAAARKAEAEENRRIALQAQLAGDLRSIDAKAAQGQAASLESRLQAVDDQYAKIFDTIAKLKKAGGTTVRGKSFADFTAEVEAGKTLLKQQETLKFDQDQIKGLEDQRVQRLQAINDAVAAGQKTALQGFEEAQAVVADLDPQIATTAKAAEAFAESIRGATPDPKLEAFIAKMQALVAQGGDSANRTNGPLAAFGRTQLGKLESDLSALTQARDRIISNEQEMVAKGAESEGQAQEHIRQAYAGTTTEINKQVKAILDLATTMHDAGTMSDTAFAALKSDLAVIGQQAIYVDANFTKIHDFLVTSFTQAVSTAFDTISTSIGQAIDGTGSWTDVLSNLGNAALSFAASFLQGLAQILEQMLILQAIKSLPFFNSLTSGIMDFTGLTAGAIALNTSSVGLTGASAALDASAAVWGSVVIGLNEAAVALTTAAGAEAAASFAMVHTGGVIGQPGSSQMRSRSVSPSIFAGAPKYHSGGVVGLKPDEQAAILKRNEEVLTANDPRNVLNGGLSGGGAAPMQPQNIKVVNAIDSGDFISAGLNTTQGEAAILNFVRARRSTIRSLIGAK